MKILCVTEWRTNWITTWDKYLKSRGHETQWIISEGVKLEEAKEVIEWSDVVLCHWASGWASAITRNFKKPIYVIIRSFENFNDVNFDRVDSVKWNNVTHAFMLNESHYPLVKSSIEGVKLKFIKNGIDLNFWKPFGEKDYNKVAWVCNVNHKKGSMLVVQAINEMMRSKPELTLEHLGKITSTRLYLYLKNIMPSLGIEWYGHGYVQDPKAVRNFLENKAYIISASMVEGHPMNILEAMACGCHPLIHRYPGVEHQFPEEYVWGSFKELRAKAKYPQTVKELRDFVSVYDYNNQYKPVVDIMEGI